jgi:predicted esterase
LGEKTLLLFIHGLGGDRTTWGKFPTLIEQDEELSPHVEIAFYGYPTRLIRLPWSKNSSRIQDLSKGIRTEFEARFKRNSRVVIIAHSMGGLIAQKYIVEELKENLALKVTDLVLFAVPVTGAPLAGWGNLFSFQHFHLRQLRKESEILESISSDWRAMSCSAKVRVVTVHGGQDKIVPRVLDSVCRSEFIADEDHQSIVKPASKDSTAFLIVRNLILEQVGEERLGSGNQLSLEARPFDVLFDAYRLEFERFYVERREDLILGGYIARQNIWLFGPSGMGKTAALTRCLVKQGSFRLISLGHYTGCSVRELFTALHETLTSDKKPDQLDPTWPRLIEALVTEMEELSRSGIRWIFVEEMPIGNPQELGEFLSRLSSLLILHNQSRGSDSIAFVFSSIVDPRLEAQDLYRISQILKVIRFAEWRLSDINKLMQLIMSELHIELSVHDQNSILSACRMSPRFIKVLFNNYLGLLPMMLEPRAALAEALASTKSEVFR